MIDLTDGVVTLTPFVLSDVAVMCLGDADPELRRRFDCPADFAPSVEHSQRVVARWDAERAAGTRLPYAIRSAGTNELLGGCEIRPAGGAVANVSYWTYPPHRNLGIATRGVQLICQLAFAELGVETLEALIDSDNAASRKVATATGFEQISEREGRLLYQRRKPT